LHLRWPSSTPACTTHGQPTMIAPLALNSVAPCAVRPANEHSPTKNKPSAMPRRRSGISPSRQVQSARRSRPRPVLRLDRLRSGKYSQPRPGTRRAIRSKPLAAAHLRQFHWRPDDAAIRRRAVVRRNSVREGERRRVPLADALVRPSYLWLQGISGASGRADRHERGTLRQAEDDFRILVRRS
jgi:hypothetical protein